MSLISTRNLWKIYTIGTTKIEAVRDVNLDIKSGEFLCIVGHSGSGKTTLLSLIGGLTRPTRGTVFIDGVDMWRLNDNELSEVRNKKIGFVFQFASLIPTLNALENVLSPLIFSRTKLNVKQYIDRAKEILSLIGLKGREKHYPSQLSGGEQRRVAIARAFINNPRIILADEPTGDLDEDTEELVMDFFLKMNKEKGITFLMVTHNKTLAKRADRVLTMRKGSIAQ